MSRRRTRERARDAPSRMLLHASSRADGRDRSQTVKQKFINQIEFSSPEPNPTADDFVHSATRASPFSVPSLHAESTISYAHGAHHLTRCIRIPSAPAPDQTSVGSRSRSRRPWAFIPSLRTSKPVKPDTESATPDRPEAHSGVGAPRWRQASAWEARRPERRPRGRRRRHATACSGHPPPEM